MVMPIDTIPEPPPSPDIVWDVGNLIQDKADELLKTAPNLTRDEAFTMAEGLVDQEREWEDICEYLTILMERTNTSGSWRAEGFDLGWRKRRGYKIFQAKTGKELLREVLPNTDCLFKIYANPASLTIMNYHHDAPTGERYEIRRYDE